MKSGFPGNCIQLNDNVRIKLKELWDAGRLSVFSWLRMNNCCGGIGTRLQCRVMPFWAHLHFNHSAQACSWVWNCHIENELHCIHIIFCLNSSNCDDCEDANCKVLVEIDEGLTKPWCAITVLLSSRSGACLTPVTIVLRYIVLCTIFTWTQFAIRCWKSLKAHREKMQILTKIELALAIVYILRTMI